mgnify:CR=1 FL=1
MDRCCACDFGFGLLNEVFVLMELNCIDGNGFRSLVVMDSAPVVAVGCCDHRRSDWFCARSVDWSDGRSGVECCSDV